MEFQKPPKEQPGWKPPATKDKQLRYCVPPPPYTDLTQKYQAIIEWIMCNDRRKDAGYDEQDIDDFCTFTGMTQEEVLRIKYSSEFVNVLWGNIKKGGSRDLAVVTPLAIEVMKGKLRSSDSKEQKEGADLFLKLNEQYGIKDIDINQQISQKTDPDELMKDIWGMVGKLILYAHDRTKSEPCDACLNVIRFFEGLKKEGSSYLDGTVQEDIVDVVGEDKPVLASRKK